MNNSNQTRVLNLECSILYPQTIPCSGHGNCNILSSMCVCEDGWSSFGDFAVDKGVDCDQNINVIQILNCITIAIVVIFVVFIIRVLYLRILIKPSIKDPPVLCSIMFLLTGLMELSYDIMKIVNPTDNIIGKSPAVSFFAGSKFLFFTYGFIIFIVILGNFFKGYAKSMSAEVKAKVEGVINFQERIFPPIIFIVTASSFMPLIGISFPESAAGFSSVFFTGFSVVWLCMVLIILSLVSVMKTELKLAIFKSDETSAKTSISPLTKIYHRLVIIDVMFKISSPFIICLFFSIGFWPYLRRKYSYFLPVQTWAGFFMMAMGAFLYLPSQTFPCYQMTSDNNLPRSKSIFGFSASRKSIFEISSNRVHPSLPMNKRESFINFFSKYARNKGGEFTELNADENIEKGESTATLNSTAPQGLS